MRTLSLLGGCAVSLFAASALADTASLDFGLPLVVIEGGWARYEAVSPDGKAPVVIRVGKAETHEGKQGRWLIIDVEVPDLGRLSVEYLVAGEVFNPAAILVTRTRVSGMPGGDSEENPDAQATGDSAPLALQLVKEGVQTVAGRRLKVRHFAHSSGRSVVWSSSVPGMGIVSVEGEDKLTLVDFGAGGDPWRSVKTPATPGTAAPGTAAPGIAAPPAATKPAD